MKITSTDFAEQSAIPSRFTCDGENLSPSLRWSDLPDGTATLALTCEDPDAPGGTFVHWVAWDIDPGAGGTGVGQVPSGSREGSNDFGALGYGGPCPPPGHGAHHYHFTIFAVSEPVELAPGASIDELRRAIKSKVRDQATLVGTYERAR